MERRPGSQSPFRPGRRPRCAMPKMPAGQAERAHRAPGTETVSSTPLEEQRTWTGGWGAGLAGRRSGVLRWEKQVPAAAFRPGVVAGPRPGPPPMGSVAPGPSPDSRGRSPPAQARLWGSAVAARAERPPGCAPRSRSSRSPRREVARKRLRRGSLPGRRRPPRTRPSRARPRTVRAPCSCRSPGSLP